MKWTDVARVVEDVGEGALSPSNVAYALCRLGCLYSFMSMQRRAGNARLPCLLHQFSCLRLSGAHARPHA